MSILACVIGYTLTGIIGLLGIAVVVMIFKGEINLKRLISEDDERGTASMSRFQFLVFTFVISMSLFYLVACSGSKDSKDSQKLSFPDIPANVFVLLGISGGSYLISKGIQKTVGGPTGGGATGGTAGGG